MDTKIEFRVLELLCSRLCHDLISPVAAINNGMELLAEGDDGMAADIRDLLAMSADAASAKLQFYRIAYGLGGQQAAPMGIEEAGRLARGLADADKIDLDWPDGASPEGALTREETKLLLNVVLLGIEGLPRGGTLTVQARPGPEGEVAVSGAGVGAGLKPESLDAMATGIDVGSLTARTVQSHFVAQIASQLGGVPIHEGDGDGRFTLRIPL